MVINLGTYTQIGGRDVVVGGSSNLDTESIVNSLVEARSLTKNILEDDVTILDDEITALATLYSVSSNLQSAVSILRNPAGIDNASDNIFEYRSVYMNSNSSVEANNYLGISVDPGAEITKFDIEINTVAAVQRDRSSLAVTSRTDSLFAADTSFDIDDGSNNLLSTIDIDAGDSLQDIASKINAVNDATGISAYILQVSDNDFRLIIEGDETGTDSAFNLDFSADATVNTALGTISNVDAATNAVFSINGVELTRQTNNIEDALEGVTLSLFEETPDYGLASSTTVSAEVSLNEELIVSAVNQFVTAYNEYRTFVAEQNERDDSGSFVETAVLPRNTTFNSIVRQIDIEVNRIIDGINTEPNELVDIGVSIIDQDATDDSIAVSAVMAVDETLLRNSISTDIDSFRSIFEFTLTDPTGKVEIYDRTNELDVSSMTLDIDKSRGQDDAAIITYTDPDTLEENFIFCRIFKLKRYRNKL